MSLIFSLKPREEPKSLLNSRRGAWAISPTESQSIAHQFLLRMDPGQQMLTIRYFRPCINRMQNMFAAIRPLPQIDHVWILGFPFKSCLVLGFVCEFCYSKLVHKIIRSKCVLLDRTVSQLLIWCNANVGGKWRWSRWLWGPRNRPNSIRMTPRLVVVINCIRSSTLRDVVSREDSEELLLPHLPHTHTHTKRDNKRL